MAQREGNNNEQDRPVVLMGRGHSGTRVLAYAVRALGVDLGFTESMDKGDPEDDRFRKGIGSLARQWRKGDAPAKKLRKLTESWRKRAIKHSPWGWKYPETYMLVRAVHAAYPGARYIHMVRDGRDLAFKHHRTSDPSTKLGKMVLSTIGALDDPQHVRAAKSWAYQVDLFRDYADHHIDPAQIHETTFEDFCRDPIGETERIGAFLGLPVPDAAREFLTGYINPKKIAQHRESDPVKVAEVEAAIGPTLRRFGYEPAPTAVAST